MSIFPAHILLATDGSEHANLAAMTAIDLARSTGSRLTGQKDRGGRRRRRGCHLKMGERRDEALVYLAEDIGAGSIVIGSRGFGGMKRVLMGNVADAVARYVHCPFLVVRPTRSVGRPF